MRESSTSITLSKITAEFMLKEQVTQLKNNALHLKMMKDEDILQLKAMKAHFYLM